MSESWPAHFPPDVVRDAYGARLAGYTISLEAWRRGLRVRYLDSQLRKYEISDGARTVKFDKTRPHLTTREAIRVEQNKFLTTSALREAGVPVPEAHIIDPATEESSVAVLRHAEQIGYPVVLKPLRGSMGRDVFTDIRDETSLSETYEYLASRCGEGEKLVLETYFQGEDYRVLVIGERATAACLRRPANVLGDGAHTVQELIDLKNARRLANPYLCKKKITQDREVEQYLDRVGYSLESVPRQGEEVVLRGRANASQGGDSIDQTEELPEVIKSAAVRAVAAIPGLAIAGVDILYDPSRQPVEDSFRVIEMNSRPEIEINMYPWQGAGQDAPRDMLDVFFPDSARSAESSDRTLALNLPQLLAPLRGAAAEEVLVRRKPPHGYPCRLHFIRAAGEWLSEELRAKVHLTGRRTSISGVCGTSEDGNYLIVAGVQENVRKFLRQVEKDLGVVRDSEKPWGGVVTQGFCFENRPAAYSPAWEIM